MHVSWSANISTHFTDGQTENQELKLLSVQCVFLSTAAARELTPPKSQGVLYGVWILAGFLADEY